VHHYHIPASTGDNSMDSDEEIRLMGEVEDLETKLKQAGHPIRKEYSDIFLQNVQTKPTPAERIPKWTNQIQILRQRLETVSVVAHPKRKAPDSRPEPAIQSHEAKVAAEQKRPKQLHNYVYTEYDDGSPPIMCPLHVDFIRIDGWTIIGISD
jgi:hypothetical protein